MPPIFLFDTAIFPFAFGVKPQLSETARGVRKFFNSYILAKDKLVLRFYKQSKVVIRRRHVRKSQDI